MVPGNLAHPCFRGKAVCEFQERIKLDFTIHFSPRPEESPVLNVERAGHACHGRRYEDMLDRAQVKIERNEPKKLNDWVHQKRTTNVRQKRLR